MNRRNIKSNISKKFNEWVASIQDTELQKRVKEHSWVTGGAITSLLMGDKPSDYDIYFDDFTTTVLVTQYYAKRIKSSVPVYVAVGEFKHIIPNTANEDYIQNVFVDLALVEQKTPRIWLVIKSAGIAGEKEAEDYQYFETIANPENVDVEKYIEELTGKIEKDGKELYQPVFSSSNAISLSGRIQLIVRFYGSIEKIHENFDFQHCKNWWRSSDGYLHLDTEALECTINKQLVYKGSHYPLASMFRIRKFMQKGWYINVADMLKIGYQISSLDLTDIKVLEDQLTGVDVAYFNSLIKHLREQKEKDPNFSMGFHYLSEVLEKVF